MTLSWQMLVGVAALLGATPLSGVAVLAASSSSAPSFVSETKKLNWFQRTLLCMNVDIRQEQYQSYRRDHKMAETQKLILHHVKGASGVPPVASKPISYAQWSEDISQYPWVYMERSLYRPPPSAEAAHGADDEDDAVDDEDFAGDDDEDEESQDAASEHSD